MGKKRTSTKAKTTVATKPKAAKRGGGGGKKGTSKRGKGKGKKAAAKPEPTISYRTKVIKKRRQKECIVPRKRVYGLSIKRLMKKLNAENGDAGFCISEDAKNIVDEIMCTFVKRAAQCTDEHLRNDRKHLKVKDVRRILGWMLCRDGAADSNAQQFADAMDTGESASQKYLNSYKNGENHDDDDDEDDDEE